MASQLKQTRTHNDRQALQQYVAVLNGRFHKWDVLAFMLVVIAHWLEHLLQAVQIFLLGWPRPESAGALGLVFPWLVKSEMLHYAYALVMLLGLALLRPAFMGRARRWWNLALILQVWHHFEHALLLGQAIAHINLFNAPAPTSIVQLLVPRVELHLFYNVVVFIPMLVAMYYHRYPLPGEGHTSSCSCAVRRSGHTPPVSSLTS